MPTTIESLPDVVIEYILSYLSPYRDLKSCMLVNKAWYCYCKAVIQKTKREFLTAVSTPDMEWHAMPTLLGPTIAKRYSHSSCCLGDSMYVFGGCTTANTTFNDLWRLDLSTRTWVRPLAIGTYPSPKACASMVAYKDSLILMGGWTHTSPYPLHQQTSWQIFNQLHIYDTISNRWNHALSYSYCPRMAGHSATVHGDHMVVFGGLRCAMNFAPFKSSNDIWVLDLVNIVWRKQAVDISQPQPLPRYGHSQVYLDSHHDLIVGGCGGPNKLFNDLWLLTMTDDPQEPWTWHPVTLLDTDYGAPHLSFHPAVKVADRLLVLSIAQSTFRPQSSMPYNLRVQPHVWMPPRPAAPAQSPAEPSPSSNKAQLKRQWAAEEQEAAKKAGGSSSSSSNGSNSRAMVSVRPNARHNRQRQLDGLNRMEQRLRTLRTGAMPPPPPPTPSVCRNPMCLYVMDLSRVISDHEVRWLPSSQVPGPEEIILYSLVAGRGEVIMFGGIQKDLNASRHLGEAIPEIVSNDLHFITAKKFVI